MDLELDPDQIELRDHARAFLTGACPPSLVRDLFEGRGTSTELWDHMVELGWPALAADPAHGGLGQGFLAEGVLASELGRVVAPGPFLATVTQFAALLTEAGGSEGAAAELTRVAEGSRTGALALAEVGGHRAADVTATARPANGSWVLDGVKTHVLDGGTAEMLAVVARLPDTSGNDGVGAFLVPRTAVTVEELTTIDPTLPLASVHLEAVEVGGTAVLLDPHDPGATAAVERARQHATVALTLSGVATCRAIFETTLEYAKHRHQFGRPIGSFQALKHRLADVYLAVERADALAWYAALTIAEDDPQRPVAVAMAKAALGDCQRLATRDGLQLHGAIGFTWEHDLHFLLKRATTAAFLLGNAENHRVDLAGLLGLAA